jgi:hypothetical protein
MDIWIEIEELAGNFENVTVAYGGIVSHLFLDSAYRFPARVNLRFFPIDTESLACEPNPRAKVIDTFSPLMAYLSNTPNRDTNMQLVSVLWNELCHNPGQQWEALRFPDVKADLLLLVTGEAGA